MYGLHFVTVWEATFGVRCKRCCAELTEGQPYTTQPAGVTIEGFLTEEMVCLTCTHELHFK